MLRHLRFAARGLHHQGGDVGFADVLVEEVKRKMANGAKGGVALPTHLVHLSRPLEAL